MDLYESFKALAVLVAPMLTIASLMLAGSLVMYLIVKLFQVGGKD